MSLMRACALASACCLPGPSTVHLGLMTCYGRAAHPVRAQLGVSPSDGIYHRSSLQASTRVGKVATHARATCISCSMAARSMAVRWATHSTAARSEAARSVRAQLSVLRAVVGCSVVLGHSNRLGKRVRVGRETLHVTCISIAVLCQCYFEPRTAALSPLSRRMTSPARRQMIASPLLTMSLYCARQTGRGSGAGGDAVLLNGVQQ